MRKPKNRMNRVVSMVEAPVLATMCARVLSRMIKSQKHDPWDQRLLLKTMTRLSDAMESGK